MRLWDSSRPGGGSPRTCTEEAKPRREHCRRQPEGRASVCARPTGRGGSVANVEMLPVPMLPIPDWGSTLAGVWRGEKPCGIICGERKTDMATKCRHCGSTNYGHGCAYGPDRLHEHRDDEKHCEWCGSSSYGHGCVYGPDRVHRHGPGGNKCIWCGSTSNGSGCPYSPTRRHEK